MQPLITGSCLCGEMNYKIHGPLRPIVACHCTQCRKTSGHYVAATQCDQTHIEIRGESLTWYRSSATAERGFCSVCGSNLFWRKLSAEKVSVSAGTIDGSSGLTICAQLFLHQKGDYYELPEVAVIQQGQGHPCSPGEMGKCSK